MSLLLSEGLLSEDEAATVWQLIQERNPVIMAAFDLCRQTGDWKELFDTVPSSSSSV